jgi:hypothetical protein
VGLEEGYGVLPTNGPMVKTTLDDGGQGVGMHRRRPTARKRSTACRELGGRSIENKKTIMLVSTNKATAPKVSPAKKGKAREGGDRHPLMGNYRARKCTLSQGNLDGRTALEGSGTTRSNQRISKERGSALW